MGLLGSGVQVNDSFQKKLPVNFLDVVDTRNNETNRGTEYVSISCCYIQFVLVTKHWQLKRQFRPR